MPLLYFQRSVDSSWSERHRDGGAVNTLSELIGGTALRDGHRRATRLNSSRRIDAPAAETWIAIIALSQLHHVFTFDPT